MSYRDTQDGWVMVESSDKMWSNGEGNGTQVQYSCLESPMSSGAQRWNSHEEIPHVQGKRYPSKTVGAKRGHQRADRLKPQSQKTNQSNHMDHGLV